MSGSVRIDEGLTWWQVFVAWVVIALWAAVITVAVVGVWPKSAPAEKPAESAPTEKAAAPATEPRVYSLDAEQTYIAVDAYVDAALRLATGVLEGRFAIVPHPSYHTDAALVELDDALEALREAGDG